MQYGRLICYCLRKTQAYVVTARHHVMQDVLATMLKLLEHTQMEFNHKTEHSQVRVPACTV